MDDRCKRLHREKDAAWIKERLSGDVRLEDASDNTALLALQGPKSGVILKKLMNAQDIPVKYYTFTEKTTLAGYSCLVSRTGYTGELGYELYCSPQDAPALWDALLEAGKDEGLVPCGLGARAHPAP
jgi:aminomethyltransferase